MADDKLTEEEQAIRDLENDDGAGEDDQQGAESPDVEALARRWAGRRRTSGAATPRSM